jgi:hypothetical protein
MKKYYEQQIPYQYHSWKEYVQKDTLDNGFHLEGFHGDEKTLPRLRQ